jgi:glucan phosphorylase
LILRSRKLKSIEGPSACCRSEGADHEREIIPRFYDRDSAGIPRGWLPMARMAIKTAGQRFGAHRMLADYVLHRYAPLRGR